MRFLTCTDVDLNILYFILKLDDNIGSYMTFKYIVAIKSVKYDFLKQVHSSTGQDETPQISSAYSLIVRSLEKNPDPAVDKMLDFVHASVSKYFLSTSSCAFMYSGKSFAKR